MDKTPKSMRLQIGLFGRVNVGKSSFLNLVLGQDAAITSPEPGTTTDVVEKPMELLPLGPVLFLDTAGLDDRSKLGLQRVERTRRVMDRADVAVLLVEADTWGAAEDWVAEAAAARKIALIVSVNKTDVARPSSAFIERIGKHTPHVLLCSCTDGNREAVTQEFKRLLIAAAPDDFVEPLTLIGDLVPAGGVAVLVVPIDLQAPRGRLILPQVQTIRDLLDHDAFAVVVKELEYACLAERLSVRPDLVVCDSQVVQKVVADTPPDVPCTTFSILFARFKGDLVVEAAGAAAIDALKSGDRVLIAEACTHHPLQDDIGRVKIPRWLRQYLGAEIEIVSCAGRDYPADLARYRLIIHCGACMLGRREMLMRLQRAREAGVPVTNYGLCIARVQGVLRRVLSPFPAALAAYEKGKP